MPAENCQGSPCGQPREERPVRFQSVRKPFSWRYLRVSLKVQPMKRDAIWLTCTDVYNYTCRHQATGGRALPGPRRSFCANASKPRPAPTRARVEPQPPTVPVRMRESRRCAVADGHPEHLRFMRVWRPPHSVVRNRSDTVTSTLYRVSIRRLVSRLTETGQRPTEAGYPFRATARPGCGPAARFAGGYPVGSRYGTRVHNVHNNIGYEHLYTRARPPPHLFFPAMRP